MPLGSRVLQPMSLARLRDRQCTQHVGSSYGVKESNSTYLERVVDDDG